MGLSKRKPADHAALESRMLRSTCIPDRICHYSVLVFSEFLSHNRSRGHGRSKDKHFKVCAFANTLTFNRMNSCCSRCLAASCLQLSIIRLWQGPASLEHPDEIHRVAGFAKACVCKVKRDLLPLFLCFLVLSPAFADVVSAIRVWLHLAP